MRSKGNMLLYNKTPKGSDFQKEQEEKEEERGEEGVGQEGGR